MSSLSLSALVKRPPLWREGGRTGLELSRLLRDPVYRGEGVPEGADRPVLLIPGFLTGDTSMGTMTQWLRRAGYRTSSAQMRANVDCSEATASRLEERLEDLVAKTRKKAAIVGQSRGGSFARVLAVRRPDLVQSIVTLGSPQVDPLAVHPLVLLQVGVVGVLGTLGVPGLFKQSCVRGTCCTAFTDDLLGAFPRGVRFVSVYSQSDGVVDWRSCLDPAAECIEVSASHCGMAVSVPVYEAVAGALERRRAPRPGRARLRLAA